MNIITGLTRTGTSVTSNLVADANPDKFIGTPFRDDLPNKFKDINPKGFWETHQSVRPIQSSNNCEDHWCKLLLGMTVKSRSDCIGKIVLTLRNPKEAAYSRNTMRLKVGGNGDGIEASPNHYVRQMSLFGYWLTANERENPHVVVYEDLIEQTETTVQKLSEYLGLECNPQIVDKKLKRSQEIVDGNNWDFAMQVYNMCKNEEWRNLTDIYLNRFQGKDLKLSRKGKLI